MAKKSVEVKKKRYMPPPEELARMYETMTAAEIAQQTGYSRDYMEKKLASLGIRKSEEAKKKLLAESKARAMKSKRLDIRLEVAQSDYRNVMERPVYDPNKRPITWRY